MEHESLIRFLGTLERLKCNLRHSWTSSGRQESVAEHSWRLAVAALLIQDEFPALDMGRVLRMCLLHDLGEAVTGDIPAFVKSSEDELNEDAAVSRLLSELPEKTAAEYASLFDEMRLCRTPEARLFAALDKLEAVIQHNEADIGTWLPLERELNLTYGMDECARFEYTAGLREAARAISEGKIARYRDSLPQDARQ